MQRNKLKQAALVIAMIIWAVASWAADKVLEIINEVAADNLIDDAIKINSVRNRVQMWLKGQTNAEE